MSTIKKFTSFTTSNCYVVVPNDKEDVCFVVDLPPDVEPCLLYTSPSPRDRTRSRMPSSA